MRQRIGVLALQGDYALHQQALERLGLESTLVYKPAELKTLDGLIIPGGESTALLKLMAPWDWRAAIIDFKRQGKTLFGTCAGMILLARTVLPTQDSLALIDITVERNAYGRQLDSQVVRGNCDPHFFGSDTCEMVFIRAPKITSVGQGVTILATAHDTPVLVQQDNVFCAAFHPELSENQIVHRRIFLGESYVPAAG